MMKKMKQTAIFLVLSAGLLILLVSNSKIFPSGTSTIKTTGEIVTLENINTEKPKDPNQKKKQQEEVSKSDYRSSEITDAGLIVPPKPRNAEEFLSDKTFWKPDYTTLRMYFAPNGRLTTQFFSPYPPYEIADIIRGNWSIQDQKLCLYFDNFKLLASKDYTDCYQYSIVFTKNGIPEYTDNLIIIDPILGNDAFFLKRQAPGNLILKPNFAKQHQII